MTGSHWLALHEEGRAGWQRWRLPLAAAVAGLAYLLVFGPSVVLSVQSWSATGDVTDRGTVPLLVEAQNLVVVLTVAGLALALVGPLLAQRWPWSVAHVSWRVPIAVGASEVILTVAGLYLGGCCHRSGFLQR